MITRTLPVILIIISIGLYFTYISPTYTQKILPLKEEISRSTTALAAADDFKQKEAQIATQRASIPQDGITKLLAYLPDGVDNVQLVLDLNGLANRSGIALSNFAIKDNTPASSAPTSGTNTTVNATANKTTNGVVSTNSIPQRQLYSNGGKTTDSLDISFTATGTYNSFRTFLNGIEHSLRPIDITQLNLTDSKTGVYTYDLTLRIYWLH